MIILHINWKYDRYGGAERYLQGIAQAQEQAGHTVAIISGKAYESDARRVGGRREFFIHASMGLRSGQREMANVLAIVASVQPDVVHFHATHNLLSPLIVRAIQKRVPAVQTVHYVGLVCPNAGDALIKVCHGELCTSPMGVKCVMTGCYSITKKGPVRLSLALWERKIAKNMDRLLVGSHYMQEELLRNGFQKEKIHIVPLYADMDPEEPSLEWSPEREKRVLFVGRLDPDKGVDRFIEALRLVRGDAWQADIVGEGPLLPYAHNLVKRLQLNERVVFHGFVRPAHLGRFYQRCSVVVVPSMMPESFGLVGIEAMSYSRPVVAFDAGGIRDWLAHGETGFLVTRGDIAGLAGRISQLLNDASLAYHMGTQARQVFAKHYRKEPHIQSLLRIYEEAIQDHLHIGWAAS